MVAKKKLLIKGPKVHDIGYRPFLLGLAESLGIERFFADNIYIEETQAVYVLIDSSHEKVKAFIEIASTRFPEKSSVEKVEEEDYTGNVMSIESYYRYLTAMQLSKIATYGGKMLEKQDIMIEKQDATMGKIDGLGEQLGNKIDGLGESLGAKIDQSRIEITSEIHSLRDDFRTRFDERLSRIEVELSEIKAKVAAIQ